ncbi:4'-phosphopantetheinyl transferase family protein [Janthinobacterium fluminis]|uniref:4'-phosphopantetheinyl transferase superfamily protein n=1 Tax=Janthinobacterium fluminis TaxID=2987524 RepID=A0ABT5K272_9BURK|nr:4'-phosphopantetheinyl transferase superfamily protein [Janthinobacterium fluminis]MDC8758366.1 4'-phosphopantetheinyl transferase superfamily protein [Janthinobacterium fluminis]
MPAGAAPLAVQPWPGPPAAPRDGVFVIGVAGPAGAPRAWARGQVRLAARQALAQLAGLPPEHIQIAAQPGRAPRALWDGGAAGLSFSHADGLSLAAVNLGGDVGVDLMRVGDWPDWQAVARDYLGPATAEALARCAPGQRARAFAQAWTAREASLKYAGLALGEWMPGVPARAWRSLTLALPAGLAGTLALPA